MPGSCPNCAAAIPDGAIFCPGCGSTSRNARSSPATPRRSDAVDPVGRRACGSCGVIAPRSGKRCAWCDASLAAPIPIPAAGDGTHWVAVRTEFQCRGCGHMSPLNELDADGSVECLRCGLAQAFEITSWREGIAHAHAVGDLAGPNREGRHPDPGVALDQNPFAVIGDTETSARLGLTGSVARDGMVLARSLRIDAAPGRPLCEKCKQPLRFSMQGDDTLARCPGCGDTGHHRLDSAARELYDGIRGACGADLRRDEPTASVDRSGAGVSALQCPSCAAPLRIPSNSRWVTCEFCRVTSRVSSRTLMSMGQEPALETWWLAFCGPSPRRAQLMGVQPEEAVPLEQPAAEPGPASLRWMLDWALPVAVVLFVFSAWLGDLLPDLQIGL